MKLLLLLISAICFLGSACTIAAPQSHAAPAPLVRCELHLSTWCIEEGAFEITRQLADDPAYDRIWIVRGRFNPASKMVIFEPNGCRGGYSNTLELLKFESNAQWKDVSWDRIQVKLKSDDSCNLAILLTPYDGDPMEWAFSEGLSLVRPCKDAACENVSISELRPAFEEEFHKLKNEKPEKWGQVGATRLSRTVDLRHIP